MWLKLVGAKERVVTEIGKKRKKEKIVWFGLLFVNESVERSWYKASEGEVYMF